jgi:ferritin-like metal-binding protein YciE
MSKIEENFMAWLHNAHAMEEQAVTMLTSFASRTRDYPEVKTRVESHLAETQTKAVCERILQEELAMASDLERQLPILTREYLNRLCTY